MEKKNFDLKSLFIGRICLISCLLFGLIAVTSSCGFGRNDAGNGGLIAEENLTDLQKENLRKQIVSYASPILIDSLNSIYIIPVVPKNLKKAERSNSVLQEAEAEDIPGRYSGSFKKGYESYYSEYMNMILWDSKQNHVKPLFSNRILITSVKTIYFSDDILLSFTVVEKDDNKDGRIDSGDFKSLYIYSLKNDKMRTVKEPGATFLEYNIIDESKNLWVKFGADRDKNGQFNSSFEPSEVKKYTWETETLEPIVPVSLNDKLQKLIEGSQSEN